jgi:hypothetical protein
MNVKLMLAFAPALLAAQGQPKAGLFFQQIGTASGTGANVMYMKTTQFEGKPTTGKPMSATRETHSLQVLADGTRIENTTRDLYYRDAEGRTRVEHVENGAVRDIVVQDPVAGTTFFLNPEAKVAHKMPAPLSAGMPPLPPPPAGAETRDVRVVQRVFTGPEGGAAGIAAAGEPTFNIMIKRTEVGAAKPVTEDLGTQTVNGVVAQGTRSTMTIPAGQMGNDRPIQVVSERWFSSDLNMLVKSTNNDPRFGETTFQLTNIQRDAPSAALFQVPSDYTVQEK